MSAVDTVRKAALHIRDRLARPISNPKLGYAAVLVYILLIILLIVADRLSVPK